MLLTGVKGKQVMLIARLACMTVRVYVLALGSTNKTDMSKSDSLTAKIASSSNCTSPFKSALHI